MWLVDLTLQWTSTAYYILPFLFMKIKENTFISAKKNYNMKI
jgi:hypothetical protein